MRASRYTSSFLTVIDVWPCSLANWYYLCFFLKWFLRFALVVKCQLGLFFFGQWRKSGFTARFSRKILSIAVFLSETLLVPLFCCWRELKCASWLIDGFNFSLAFLTLFCSVFGMKWPRHTAGSRRPESTNDYFCTWSLWPVVIYFAGANFLTPAHDIFTPVLFHGGGLEWAVYLLPTLGLYVSRDTERVA